MGKGAALAKGARDVRPIVTLHPLLQMAGHCLVTEHRNAIKEVVGDGQLMGTSAGPEILVPMLQHALERDPNVVLIKLDSSNAFNSIRGPAVMSAVEESTPELAPFMAMLLNMSPTQVVYNDMRQRITLVHHMASLPQGA